MKYESVLLHVDHEQYICHFNLQNDRRKKRGLFFVISDSGYFYGVGISCLIDGSLQKFHICLCTICCFIYCLY